VGAWTECAREHVAAGFGRRGREPQLAACRPSSPGPTPDHATGGRHPVEQRRSPAVGASRHLSRDNTLGRWPRKSPFPPRRPPAKRPCRGCCRRVRRSARSCLSQAAHQARVVRSAKRPGAIGGTATPQKAAVTAAAVVAAPIRLPGESLPSLSSPLPTHGTLLAPPLCLSLVGPRSLLEGCPKRQSGLTVGTKWTNVLGGSHSTPPRAPSATETALFRLPCARLARGRERTTHGPGNQQAPPRGLSLVAPRHPTQERQYLGSSGAQAGSQRPVYATTFPPPPPLFLPIRFPFGRPAPAPGRRRSCVTTPTSRSNTTVSNRSTHTPLSDACPTRTGASCAVRGCDARRPPGHRRWRRRADASRDTRRTCAGGWLHPRMT